MKTQHKALLKKDPSEPTKVEERWRAWEQTLSRLNLATAFPSRSDADVLELNDVAQNDLRKKDRQIPASALCNLRRTFLIQETDSLVWIPQTKPVLSYRKLLTPREMQVHQAHQQGLSLAESSELLGIAPRTVEKHRRNIRLKLEPTT